MNEKQNAPTVIVNPKIVVSFDTCSLAGQFAIDSWFNKNKQNKTKQNTNTNTHTCVGVPKMLAKSARKAAIALYWTKLTVENFVTER